GEGHADLDDVGTRLRQRLDDVERGFRIGIAGHQERDQRGATFTPEFGKTCVDAGGHNALFAARGRLLRTVFAETPPPPPPSPASGRGSSPRRADGPVLTPSAVLSLSRLRGRVRVGALSEGSMQTVVTSASCPSRFP